MTLRLFIVAAIVLTVFAIIAQAGTGTLFGVEAFIWLAAGLLAYFVDVLVGGWAWAVGPPRQAPPA